MFSKKTCGLPSARPRATTGRPYGLVCSPNSLWIWMQERGGQATPAHPQPVEFDADGCLGGEGVETYSEPSKRAKKRATRTGGSLLFRANYAGCNQLSLAELILIPGPMVEAITQLLIY